ncbi:hypothetical protein VNO77_08378 [Canavalia gladiata]|uniref:Uncharacterized protein n=1 Tax=Canavalia gladiata TaxID=3824 RepID=A0AAN9QWK7_CANGL
MVMSPYGYPCAWVTSHRSHSFLAPSDQHIMVQNIRTVTVGLFLSCFRCQSTPSYLQSHNIYFLLIYTVHKTLAASWKSKEPSLLKPQLATSILVKKKPCGDLAYATYFGEYDFYLMVEIATFRNKDSDHNSNTRHSNEDDVVAGAIFPRYSYLNSFTNPPKRLLFFIIKWSARYN